MNTYSVSRKELTALILTLSMTSVGQTFGATTNAISPGETLTNQAITVVGQTNFTTFTGASNEAVSILMSKTGGGGNTPYFELYGPNGGLLATPGSVNSLISYLDAYRLPASGPYLFFFNDTATTETYTYNLT